MQVMTKYRRKEGRKDEVKMNVKKRARENIKLRDAHEGTKNM
jgi:hypothetical protein